MSALSGSYYVYHLEKAPITGNQKIVTKYQESIIGRIRFINIGVDQEEDISNQSLDEILKINRDLILPSYHPTCLKIKSIVDNLAKNIQDFIPDIKTNFSVFVIENPEPNAFVLPGGQIFVNTGLLSVAVNDEGLATVLAHEVIIFQDLNVLMHIDCPQIGPSWSRKNVNIPIFFNYCRNSSTYFNWR